MRQERMIVMTAVGTNECRIAIPSYVSSVLDDVKIILNKVDHQLIDVFHF